MEEQQVADWVKAIFKAAKDYKIDVNIKDMNIGNIHSISDKVKEWQSMINEATNRGIIVDISCYDPVGLRQELDAIDVCDSNYRKEVAATYAMSRGV